MANWKGNLDPLRISSAQPINHESVHAQYLHALFLPVMSNGAQRLVEVLRGYDGTLIDTAVIEDSPQGARLELDGTDDYVTANPAAIPLDEGTVFVFVRLDFDPNFGAGNPMLFDTDTSRYVPYFGGGGTPTVVMYNDGRNRGFLSSGKWASGDDVVFAFAYQKSSNTQQAYINGAALTQQAPATGTWGSNAHGSNMYIGCKFDQDSTTFVNGCYYEIRVYNKLLTADHIREISDVTRTRTTGFLSYVRKSDAGFVAAAGGGNTLGPDGANRYFSLNPMHPMTGAA